MPVQMHDEMAYGLHHIAHHNAELPSLATAIPVDDNAGHGLGIDFVSLSRRGNANPSADCEQNAWTNEYDHPNYKQEHSYSFSDPRTLTPFSSSNSPGPEDASKRTRSGRVIKQRHDSPLSQTRDSNSRVSKSPKPRKTKGKGASSVSRLSGPLSELTKDSEIPVKDIEAWVTRSAAERVEESKKRKGHIARPMNSFMLYRSAYAERTKGWCKQNNHQVVSSVAGESWPLESDELRDQFNEWARIERDNHAKAFPDYKFSPSKTSLRKRQEDEDEEDDLSAGNPDAEYLPSGRPAKQVRSNNHEYSYPLSSPYVVDQYRMPAQRDPYAQSWVATQQPRPLPSNGHGMMEPYGGHHYYHSSAQPNHYIPQMDDMRVGTAATPESLYGVSPRMGLPSSHQQWRSPATSSYQPAAHYPPPPANMVHCEMARRASLYHERNAQPYTYTLPQTESHFDDAYESYPGHGSYISGDTNWSNMVVDPSLMGIESDELYSQGR